MKIVSINSEFMLCFRVGGYEVDRHDTLLKSAGYRFTSTKVNAMIEFNVITTIRKVHLLLELIDSMELKTVAK